MKLFQEILKYQYDEVLESIQVGRLISMASNGLLSQEESTFNECHKVLVELFTRPYTSICKKRPETNSIVVRLYNSHVHRIVKNCIEVILSQRAVLYVKGCGHLLHVMNAAEVTGFGKRLKIERGFINDILENYPEKISQDKNIADSITKILNASSKEAAEDLAISTNSKINE
ncbi:hypothetical protein RF11_01979 [Thelohanellus kitauei]|uniref:Uncharacterized protein n=1 Tax=Thelohanellus kitauei TaxID=669202 RepID=A0A0C2JFD7_THEKT|nr:hypothetical protein RF11_01979 [Thelohanellus kitauei]